MTDYPLSTTIYRYFTTSVGGVPTTLAGTPVVSAYADNSTTEITAGITLTVDCDSRTGMHKIAIVASGANGFASGTDYALVVTTGTVGGSSVVGTVVAEFSIEKASALRPATSGRTLVVDADGLADANTVKLGPTGAGTAQTARDIGASVLVAGDLSATMKTSVQIAADAAVTANTLVNTLAGYVDTEVSAIKAKTDNLPPNPAATSDIPTATENADALLNRDMSAVSDTNARSPLNALRFIRNKWSISGATLTVKKEDDSTTAWTASVSTTAGADPVTGNDPA